jgi:phage gp36-like protein
MSYCVRADLATYGVSAVALAPIDTAVQDAACQSASEVVDSYFRDRFKLPLSSWGIDVTRVTAVIAVYDLLVVRGYNPSAGADVNVRMRYEDALKWLLQVARQEVQPNVTPQQHDSPGYDAPRILTNSSRGWGGADPSKVLG